MGLLCFVYLIGSLRTNICFFLVFLTLVFAFGLLTGAYWMIALDAQSGTMTYATKIPKLLKVKALLIDNKRSKKTEERNVLIISRPPVDLLSSHRFSAGGSSSLSS